MRGNDPGRPAPYRIAMEGYSFRMERPETARLRRLPDFESKEEPAGAEDFLRSRAEQWAENLAAAGVGPGEVEVRVDPHERRAKLYRGEKLLFAAEI